MAWFKNIIEKILLKNASKIDIKNNALQQLQNGIAPYEVGTSLIQQMGQIDPEFGTSDTAGSIIMSVYSADALANAINSIPDDPIAPPIAPEQDMATPQEIPVEAPIEAPVEEAPVKEAPVEEAPGEENKTPLQEISEEMEFSEDLQQEEAGVLPEDKEGEYDNIEISPEEMVIEEGMEVSNPIPQKEFSIPFDYLAKLNKSLKKISDYKDEQGQSPLAIRFLTEDGSPSSQPVKYQKEAQSPMGETFYVDYVNFVLEGEPPNPLGDTVKKMRDNEGNVILNEKGRPITKEVIYQIIAFLELLPKEGFEPQEIRFKTKEEAIAHASSQGGPLWAPGKRLMTDSKTGEKYWPSIFRGKWRTHIDRYPNTPDLDDRFKQGNPLDCDHCHVAKRGKVSRKRVFIAIEYPAEQLRTEAGERRDPTMEESARGKQVQIGTGCVSKHKKALDFIHDLENLKVKANSVENLGRESDSFGGSMSSAKSLPQIMSNYLTAREYRPGRRGNWYKKRWGNEFNDSEMKKFKSYYFGHKRAAMRKAAIEVFKYERDMEEWDKASQQAQLTGQPIPKKPSGPPPGPEALPWKETTPEKDQKAEEIINWWKAKENDPSINLNTKEGLETHNVATLALHGKIDSKHFDAMGKMVYQYEREQSQKRREEEMKQREEQRRGRDEENAYVDNESWNARKIRERQEEEQRATRVEELGSQGEAIQDITQIREGQPFTSELKHIKTKEYGRGGGRYSDFKDNEGNNYRIFDNYGKQRRDPKYNFEDGEDYILKGKKGSTSHRYNNTTLNNVEVINTNAPTPVAVPDIPEVMQREPETILDEVPEQVEGIERYLPIAGRQKVSPINLRNPVYKLTEKAMEVISTGSTSEGYKMKPNVVISLYVTRLDESVPGGIGDTDIWKQSLHSALKDGKLLDVLEIIPEYFAE